MSGTKAGHPSEKWQEDPVSALHEHYHQKGVGELEYGFSPRSGEWVCTLQTPSPVGTFEATARNKPMAKRKAALAACKNLFT